MAELTDREYTLIMEGIRSASTAVQSVGTTLTDLRVGLSERYITRDEAYRYMGEVEDGLKSTIGILKWVIAGLSTALLALAGWVIVH